MKKHESDINDLIQKIGAIFEGTKALAQQVVKLYSVEVEAIINERSQDEKRIEWYLSYMLDFCFDDEMLLLYKKLCQYYYDINPKATVRQRPVTMWCYKVVDSVVDSCSTGK
ncbi:MAG: hypothetical protein GX568_03760 [Candidatus Gastranaerophilales bacterium]|nr:hypothetical protein [Candidatus Gastranaerophilales bacterium]